MSSVAHPFLILHDPGDEICEIEGSRMLVKQSVTPDENKELIEVSSLTRPCDYIPPAYCSPSDADAVAAPLLSAVCTTVLFF
jgi:hypothetical protein